MAPAETCRPTTLTSWPPATLLTVPLKILMGEISDSWSPRPKLSSKGAPRWATPEVVVPLIFTAPAARSTTSSPAAMGPSVWPSVPVVRLPWERTATSRPAVSARVDTLAPLVLASRPTSWLALTSDRESAWPLTGSVPRATILALEPTWSA